MGCVIGVLVLGQSEGLAGRPGKLGDRHFRKSERGPGILTDRLAKRKIAREASREKVRSAAAAAESSRGANATRKRNEPKRDNVGRQSLETASESEKRGDRSEVQREPGTVRETLRVPGRSGKGTGPTKRRRVILKPLFGN